MALRKTTPRRVMTLSGVLSASLVLAACGGGGTGTGGGDSTAANVDCAAYKAYGDLKGKTVSVYTGIVTPEDTAYINSYKPFEQCTGAAFLDCVAARDL